MGTSSSISQGDSEDKGVAVTSQGDREDKGVASPLREGTEGKKKRPIDSQKQSADIICTERSKTKTGEITTVVTRSKRRKLLAASLPLEVISTLLARLLSSMVSKKSTSAKSFATQLFAALHVTRETRSMILCNAELMGSLQIALRTNSAKSQLPDKTSWQRLYSYFVILLTQSPDSAVRNLIFKTASLLSPPVLIAQCAHVADSHVLSLLKCNGAIRLNITGCKGFSIVQLVNKMREEERVWAAHRRLGTIKTLIFKGNYKGDQECGYMEALNYLRYTLTPVVMRPRPCDCDGDALFICPDCGCEHPFRCDGCEEVIPSCNANDWRRCKINFTCDECSAVFCSPCVQLGNCTTFTECDHGKQLCLDCTLTCSLPDCKKTICSECVPNGYCMLCEKQFCGPQCREVQHCQICDTSSCSACMCMLPCHSCNDVICRRCFENTFDYPLCIECEELHCLSCHPIGDSRCISCNL